MLKRLLHYVGILFGIGVFAAAIYVLAHQLRDLRWEDLWDQLAAIPAYHIVLSLGFTAGAYLILTVYDCTAFAYIGRRISYARVAFVSFLAYSFSHSLGFGSVTGSAVRYRFYSAWGVRALDIGAVIVFGGMAYILGAVAVAGAMMLVNASNFSHVLSLPPEVIHALGAVFVLAGCVYLVWSALGRPTIRVKNTRLPPPRLRLVLAQLAVGCLEWLFASAALYWLFPAIPVDYWHFFGVFIVAYLAGMVSNVPQGLGVLEAVMIGLLPGGEENRAAVFAAFITYRALYFVLPLLMAAVLFSVYEFRHGHLRVAKMQQFRTRFRRGKVPPAEREAASSSSASVG